MILRCQFTSELSPPGEPLPLTVSVSLDTELLAMDPVLSEPARLLSKTLSVWSSSGEPGSSTVATGALPSVVSLRLFLPSRG